MKLRINHSAQADGSDEPTSSNSSKKSKKMDTPPSTLKKVRALIMDEGYYSTTELAERLNGFRPGDTRPTEPIFPRASGTGKWTSADVASLLDRKDMEDLKPRLVANRPKPEPQPAAAPSGLGISPLEFRQALADDLGVLLKEQSESVTQTLSGLHVNVDTLRRTVAALEQSSQGGGVSQGDLAVIHGKINEAIKANLGAVRVDGAQAFDKVVADTADEVCAVFEKVVKKTDFPAVYRMSKQAAENIGEVCKKIDDLTAEVFDTLQESTKTLAKAVKDENNATGEVLLADIEERFAAFMTQVNDKVQAAVDAQVSEIVNAAVDRGFTQIQNSIAVQQAKYERLLESVIDKKVTTALNKLDERLKRLEDEEAEWNEQ